MDEENILIYQILGSMIMYNVTNGSEIFLTSIYSQFGTPVSTQRNSILYNGISTSPTLDEYIWTEKINREILPFYDNNLLTFKNTTNNHLVLEHPFKHIDVASQDRIDSVTEELEYEFREPSAFSDDDSLFASATNDGKVLIWDMDENGFLKRDKIDGTENSNHITFSPNNRYLALARNQIALYDRQKDWKEKNILDGHTGAIYSLDFAMDSSHMASGGEDGKLVVWDLSTLEGQTILQIDQPIKFVTYFEDNSILYVTSSGKIYRYRIGELQLLNDELNLEDISAVTITDDKRYLIVDGSVFDTSTGDLLGEFGKEESYIKYDVSYNNEWIAGYQGDTVVRVWDFQKIIEQEPITPTNIPTSIPTDIPTSIPTSIPTNFLTNTPTNIPTSIPTNIPTSSPTNTPIIQPTQTPTNPPPTLTPTPSPTSAIALNTVIVTDDMTSSEDLSGGIDEDGESDRCLVIRWNLSYEDIQDTHVYVSIDGGPIHLFRTNG